MYTYKKNKNKMYYQYTTPNFFNVFVSLVFTKAEYIWSKINLKQLYCLILPFTFFLFEYI